MAHNILIESQYFPSITYLATLLKHGGAIIDRHEHFVKGTYRNRCHIYGANGMLRLSVPLLKGKHQRRAMQDVTISYDHDWRKLHWQSIETAYRRSPYFEYYEDDFAPLFQEKFASLIELNTHCLNWLKEILQLHFSLEYSTTYIPANNESYMDLRSAIHPKKEKQKVDWTMKEYEQVYSNKMPFIANLSMLDLLFNLGPRSKRYLEELIANNA